MTTISRRAFLQTTVLAPVAAAVIAARPSRLAVATEHVIRDECRCVTTYLARARFTGVEYGLAIDVSDLEIANAWDPEWVIFSAQDTVRQTLTHHLRTQGATVVRWGSL